MKIAVLQMDGKMPNLALMKIAAYYISKGHEVVRYADGDVDKVFASVIFQQHLSRSLGVLKFFTVPCEIGGSGYDLNKSLPNDVEHIMPAYGLWNIDYSMGFTSRGCIRNCEFCIVPKKEGGIKSTASLDEFIYPSHKKVILLDNNLLASPDGENVLLDLVDRSIKVNFNQGLDIRLVNEENAGLLSGIKYTNRHFTNKQLYFAFDDLKYEKQVRNGIETLLGAGIKPAHLMFYVLVGFNSTFKDDLKRYKILWEEYGVYPFVMIYNNRKDDERIRAFARWVNRRIHKSCSWEDYNRNPDFVNEVEI